jgi:hypothetical protein
MVTVLVGFWAAVAAATPFRSLSRRAEEVDMD